jgi:hypothetical protein
MPNSQIPQNLRRWLDDEMAGELEADPADPRVREIAGKLDALMDELGLSDYSIRAIRDLHYLKYPGSSIATLAISDELFIGLICIDVETVDALQAALTSGQIAKAMAQHYGKRQGGIQVSALQNAINQWRRASF